MSDFLREYDRTKRVPWVPLVGRKECSVCNKPFACCRKQHNCYSCGDLCCGGCSSKSFKLVAWGKQKVRVCDLCHDAYKQHHEVTGDRDDAHMDTSLLPRKEYPRGSLWMPDLESNKCMTCETPFNFCRRRHHCRNCGYLVCGGCSSKTHVLSVYGEEAQRICDGCFGKLAEGAPEFTEGYGAVLFAGTISVGDELTDEPPVFKRAAGKGSRQPGTARSHHSGRIHRHTDGRRVKRVATVRITRPSRAAESMDDDLSSIEGNLPRSISAAVNLLAADRIMMARSKVDAIDHIMGLLRMRCKALEVKLRRAVKRNQVTDPGDVEHLKRIKELIAQFDASAGPLRTIRNKSNAARALLKQLESGEGWTPCIDKEGVVITSRVEEGTVFQTFKVEADVAGNVLRLIAMLFEPDHLLHVFGEETLAECVEVAKLEGERKKLVHFRVNFPRDRPRSRDVVILSHFIDMLEEKALLVQVRSVSKALKYELPLQDAGVKRAQMFGGIILRITGRDSTRLQMVFNVDFRQGLLKMSAVRKAVAKVLFRAVQTFREGVTPEVFEHRHYKQRMSEDVYGMYTDLKRKVAPILRLMAKQQLAGSRPEAPSAASASVASSDAGSTKGGTRGRRGSVLDILKMGEKKRAEEEAEEAEGVSFDDEQEALAVKLGQHGGKRARRFTVMDMRGLEMSDEEEEEAAGPGGWQPQPGPDKSAAPAAAAAGAGAYPEGDGDGEDGHAVDPPPHSQ